MILLLLLLIAPGDSTDLSSGHVNEWGEAIESYFHGFVTARLKKDDLRELYLKQSYTVDPERGANALEALYRAVSLRVGYIEQVVGSMATQISANIAKDNTGEGTSCCTGWRIQPDDAFPVKVNHDDSCYMTPGELPYTDEIKSAIRLGNSLADTFVDNAHFHSFLKWQFFASETGVFRLYPTRRWPRPCSKYSELDCPRGCDGKCVRQHHTCQGPCGTYDPRQEKWYGLAVATVPWDVLFVIDSSHHMRFGPRWGAVKDAVGVLLRQLTTDSAVNIVLFDDETVYTASAHPSEEDSWLDDGCFSTGLVRASPSSVAHLSNFLAYAPSARPESGKDIALGMEKATEMIRGSYQASSAHSRVARDTLIVLLTADGPTTTAPGMGATEKIKASIDLLEEKYLGGRIARVLSLQLGATPPADAAFLAEIATDCQNVPDGEAVGVLRSYYHVLAEDPRYAQHAPVWTTPECSPDGLGVVSTVVEAVYDHTSRLAGVVGTHVPLQALFAEVIDFRDALSYAFVLDENGDVLLHPRLKDPIGERAHPAFPSFASMEQGPMLERVRDQIMSESNGELHNVTIQHALPRGSHDYEGVVSRERQASFLWRQVKGQSLRPTLFTIVVVWFSADANTLSHVPRMINDDIYHRIDMYKAQSKAEEVGNDDPDHPHLIISEDRSVYKIGPKGFADSYRYLSGVEDAKQVEAISSFINGVGEQPTPNIKAGAERDIHLTALIEKSWIAGDQSGLYNGKESIVWRYVGTPSGVFRIFPGTNIRGKHYDPTRRPWYDRALANNGDIAFSYPHRDPLSGKVIVTMSTAIYDSSKEQRPLAVMGLDLHYAYFARTIQGLTGCNGDSVRCFILDKSGYLLSHPDFAGNDELDSPRFAASTERILADVLMRRNDLFDFDACLDLQGALVKHFYVSKELPPVVQSGVLHSSAPKASYFVRPLVGMNAVLVAIESAAEKDVLGAVCSCQATCSSPEDVLECQAPCACELVDNGCIGAAVGGENTRICPSRFRESPLEIGADYSWILPVVIGSVAIVGATATSAYVYYRKSNMGVSFYYYVISFLLHAPIQYMARMGVFRFRVYLRYIPTTWRELVRIRVPGRDDINDEIRMADVN